MEFVNQELISLLNTLCNTGGVPGAEGPIRKIIRTELQDHVDSLRTDHLGNLYAEKKSKGKPRLKLMIAAHMDEVGFMIVNASDEEFYEFRVLGGVDPRVLPAKRVRVGKNEVEGIISPRTAHLTKAEERKKFVPVDQLRITVGKENIGKINAGDVAWFEPNFSKLGSGFSSKALDDRVGCANLIWLLKNAPDDIDLVGVFTTQEELGLRGATVAANQVNPDMALVLDTTPAIEPPLMDHTDENVLYNTRCGYGPAIYTVDRGQIHDQRFIQFIESIAKTSELPYQKRQPGGGGTDGSAIHLQLGGIPCQSVSVPVRYLHTPSSFMRQDDWNNTLKLLFGVVQKISPAIYEEARK